MGVNLPGDKPWQRTAFLIAVPSLVAPFFWAFSYSTFWAPFPDKLRYLFQAALLFDGSSSDSIIVWTTRVGIIAVLVRLFGEPVFQWISNRPPSERP